MMSFNDEDELDLTFKRYESVKLQHHEKEEIFSKLVDSIECSERKNRFFQWVHPILSTACIVMLLVFGGYYLADHLLMNGQVDSDQTAEDIPANLPDGMEVYTHAETNIFTVKPVDWETVTHPNGNPASIYFQTEKNINIGIHQSVYSINTVKTDTETDYLREAYAESVTYEEFIVRFRERFLSNTPVEEMDKVNGQIPVFLYEENMKAYVFAVTVADNTPYMIEMSFKQDAVDAAAVKGGGYYDYFTAIIEHTRPLE
ncbi:hypothetical protein SAMN05421736_101806 [Evansella caseinilytica]|uniref:Uncharacterized protein n=1 Tax=Evansella caseinilytica TaxID=1503961 RepID=A0A1H3IEH7_9BACI|nr:hypothetical protein [Evansella caseinilytica]SDY26263.1 hypothetical protein SAMN05421736_101806 [Evansella caseinilytica]